MQTTRRHFLTGAAAAAAGPYVLTASRAWGQEAAPRVVRLGHIGVGGQGSGLLTNFLSAKGAQSVAIADPYGQRLQKAGAKVKSLQGHDPKLYSDFRELLANPEVDAVVIATPDHWHVPVALAAVRAGKDVYLEKPLGYTMMQNKALEQACLKQDCIFQYGTQQRSKELIKRGVELVINGVLGEIERTEIWAPAGRGGGSTKEIPVPEGLDYEMYIGPAPMKPCTKDRIKSPSSWYCRDYALGFIAGWGAHPLDVSIWGQQHDIAGPYKLKGTGKAASPNGLFNAISTWDVQMEFSNGMKSRFMSSDVAKPVVGAYRSNWENDGTTFYGSKGWISLSRGSVASSNMDWFRDKLGPDAIRVPYVPNYYQGFVDAVRDHRPSVSPIGDAVRSDAMSHLALMAIESGEEVVWDPKAYQIVSPGNLNERMSTTIRGDWAQS